MGSRFWPCFLVFLSACVPPMPGYTGHDNPGHDFDGDGWTEADGDCDDQVGTTHPEADETCNGIDDDCNDLVDDGAVDEFEWTLDEDNDGYGKDSTAQMACTAPTPSYVTQGGDCDDNRADVHPGATEWCDGGTDEDCDGLVDLDDDDMAGNATWYQDLDGDGHGNLEVTLAACTQPPGYSALDDDCDDENSRRHPGHEELCDGIDNN